MTFWGGTFASALAATLLRHEGASWSMIGGLLVVTALCGAGIGLQFASHDDSMYADQVGLVTAIGLPLCAIAALLYCLGSELTDGPAQAMFLNLSATAIGAIMVVFLVDGVIHSQERDQWSQVRESVLLELRRIASVAVYVVNSCHKPAEEIPQGHTSDPLQFLRSVVLPNLRPSILQLTESELEEVAGALEGLRSELDRILALHERRLSFGLVSDALFLSDFIRMAVSDTRAPQLESEDFKHISLWIALREIGLRGEKIIKEVNRALW